MSLFKRQPVYIRISLDKIQITNLHTGQSVSATEKFSTTRITLADFNKLDLLIRNGLRELIQSKSVFPVQFNILIQQAEEVEGGISETEKRALRDLAELAGGIKVRLVNHTRKLSEKEALLELNAGD